MADNENGEMSFLEHLEELRWHLIRSLAAIVAFGIVAFIFKEFTFDTLILGPSRSEFFTNKWLCVLGHKVNSSTLCLNTKPIKLQSIEMAGQFTAHIKIAIISGLIVAFPYIFFEFWRFVKPALNRKELTLAHTAVFSISILFFLGVLFGYYIICPLSINFLYNYQVSNLAENNIKLMSYVSTVSSICLAAGVLFELPVVVFFFSKLGLLTPKFLKKYRRHAIIVILVIAAVITPPDVFSQILVSIPILFLYEISIYISGKIYKKRSSDNIDDSLNNK